MYFLIERRIVEHSQRVHHSPSLHLHPDAPLPPGVFSDPLLSLGPRVQLVLPPFGRERHQAGQGTPDTVEAGPDQGGRNGDEVAAGTVKYLMGIALEA